MSQARGPSKGDAQRRHRFGWLRVVLGMGLLVLVCASVNWREVGHLLWKARWGWVLLAVVFQVANRFLSALKWQVLLQAKGFEYPFGELLHIVWISNFFGHFLPSAVGGDSLRMWQMASRSERAPEAVSTVFVERLTGATSLAALAVVGGLWGWVNWGEHRVIVALTLPVAVLLVSLALLWTSPGERALDWALSHFHRLPGYPSLTKAREAVHSFRQQPKPVLLSLALSLVVQLTRVASVFCLAKALGVLLFFGEALVLVPSALFIAMLPISIGGLGLHEGAFIVFLGLAHVGKSAAFGVALLSRLATMASNLPGGVLFLLEGFGRRHTSAGAAHAPDRNGKPLRVLWLADKLGYGEHLHGLGQYYLTVAPAMRGAEVIPGVFHSTNGLSARLAAAGVRLQEFRGGVWNPWTFWTLLRYVRREQVDLLHVHGYGSAALGRIAGWLTHRPVIMHQHDSVARPWAIRLVDRALSRLATHTIAVSESVRAFCVAARALPMTQVSVLPLAVAAQAPLSAAEQAVFRDGFPPQARLIGCITRFHPVKGVRYLIEAMPTIVQAVPEAYLVLWGDGPQRAELEQLAARLGLEQRIRFMGHQADAARYLELVDCLVLPSMSEGCPFVLLEAMSAKRPIVATRVGGVTELVRDSEDALLVESGNPRALAQAVTTLLNDHQLAERLASAAGIASERFSLTSHTDALERIYRSATHHEETPDARTR